MKLYIQAFTALEHARAPILTASFEKSENCADSVVTYGEVLAEIEVDINISDEEIKASIEKALEDKKALRVAKLKD